MSPSLRLKDLLGRETRVMKKNKRKQKLPCGRGSGVPLSSPIQAALSTWATRGSKYGIFQGRLVEFVPVSGGVGHDAPGYPTAIYVTCDAIYVTFGQRDLPSESKRSQGNFKPIFFRIVAFLA